MRLFFFNRRPTYQRLRQLEFIYNITDIGRTRLCRSANAVIRLDSSRIFARDWLAALASYDRTQVSKETLQCTG